MTLYFCETCDGRVIFIYHITKFMVIIATCVIKDVQQGRTVFIIKRSLEKYIISGDKSYIDAIMLNLVNGNNICGIYIPPSDSHYFSNPEICWDGKISTV